MEWNAKTIQYIGKQHFIIADTKRGDIGNTAQAYAQALFQQLGADAVTLHPYMGLDSVQPFLAYPGKISILLGFTSNPGAEEIPNMPCQNGQPLFVNLLKKCNDWASPEQ